MAKNSEDEDVTEHLETASFWVRFQALFTQSSMRLLMAMSIAAIVFTFQMAFPPPKPNTLTVNRVPFEEALARLDAEQAKVKSYAAEDIPADKLRPLLEQSSVELEESIAAVRGSLRGQDPELGFSLPSLVTEAFAATEDAEQIYSTDQRTMLVTGIIGAIFVFWIFCFVLYFVSKDKEKVKFAGTMIQTVLGFYIGIVTGMMGAPRR
ncbi:hypothetical protein G6L63_03760 [Agrobacterium vitis]|uniref:Uncharacterized protein n=1 Tax=Agrobacterium vitis TaxID=373 RepID=A0A368NWV8_AGRVI|nr:hypothetical protein [Agrobacterium vitis]KAA3519857.1 hypothetical protein DXM22_03060 [Agrobacterium vitis]KAA3531930.1 hypothetical protein DXT89_00675 [Agrobacterium vitis]MCF1476040.1 hypothetical protein [Agrobacterium vitis]MUZ96901.1 hypothetical protein [Agrobacterium vitis]MVA29074.1 hypothetical protein [Agrobacterium vitis]